MGTVVMPRKLAKNTTSIVSVSKRSSHFPFSSLPLLLNEYHLIPSQLYNPPIHFYTLFHTLLFFLLNSLFLIFDYLSSSIHPWWSFFTSSPIDFYSMSDPNTHNSITPAQQDDADRKKNKREGRIRRAKKSALFRFRNLKNQLQRKKRKLNFGFSGKKSGASCLSFNFTKKALNLDSSPGDSQTSDPNHPDFTLDLLRGLIEKNDFYSPECNTHFDVHVDTDDS